MALSSRLRRLQEELAALQEGRRPLGAFLDPDLGRQAEDVRGRREASLRADAGGAAAQGIRRLGKIERGREQFPGRRPGGTGATGLDRTDKEGYLRLLGEQREGADLEAALSGRPAPTVQVEPSASRAFTVRGVRKIGTLGAGGRAQEAAPATEQPVESAGDRDERARINAARRRQEEAATRKAEREAQSPLEDVKESAAAEQFLRRQDVEIVPDVEMDFSPTARGGTAVVKGVRRAGETRFGPVREGIGPTKFRTAPTRRASTEDFGVREREARLHPNVLAAEAYASRQGSAETPDGDVSPYQQERQVRILESVDELQDKVGRLTTGIGGSVLNRIPETQARNFKAELETLKANIAFGELVAMREASKTGGALGQVSDREGQLLQAALGALDIGQSPENFREQLEKIRSSLERWQAAQRGEIQRDDGPEPNSAPARSGRFRIIEEP